MHIVRGLGSAARQWRDDVREGSSIRSLACRRHQEHKYCMCRLRGDCDTSRDLLRRSAQPLDMECFGPQLITQHKKRRRESRRWRRKAPPADLKIPGWSVGSQPVAKARPSGIGTPPPSTVVAAAKKRGAGDKVQFLHKNATAAPAVVGGTTGNNGEGRATTTKRNRSVEAGLPLGKAQIAAPKGPRVCAF